MQKVTLYIDVNRTIEIVHELKQMGWVMGKDFDFAHLKPEYDNFTGFNYDPVKERRTMFTFYNDSNASFFTIKYS